MIRPRLGLETDELVLHGSDHRLHVVQLILRQTDTILANKEKCLALTAPRMLRAAVLLEDIQ